MYPNREYSDITDSHLGASLNVVNSNICETIPHFEFTATNCMTGTNLWDEIFVPNIEKVGYFSIFYGI